VSERDGVNKLVLIINVCTSRALFEIVILVHGYEENKITSERLSSADVSIAAYIDVKGELDCKLWKWCDTQRNDGLIKWV
jgi:hypothetical protein